jgi:hypothetical protein
MARGGRFRRWRQRDRAIITEIVEIMDVGAPYFRYEGACRAGLRAAFCLEGEQWHRADIRSGRIVAAALVELGAVRPTWAEGQPGWTDPGYAPGDVYYCHRCAKPMPEGTALGAKFCSDDCKRANYFAGARAHQAQMSRAEYKAMLATVREKKLIEHGLTCVQCGERFLPFDKAEYHPERDIRDSRRYCSRRCRDRACAPRQCAHCGQMFKPKKYASAKFCSDECRSRVRNRRWRERQREASQAELFLCEAV